MENETMVTETNEAAEELLPEALVEETEDTSEDLASILGGSDEQPAEQPEESPRQEPGYVKGRIDKAVARAVAETEARMRADFEQQMAPYREQMITMEAQELVRTGQVKDLETAKELVRYRQGQPQTAAPAAESQPRNAQGQFTAKQTADPATSARIDMLQHQADRIRANGGPDVIKEFKTNEEIRNKVISGELDFYEVAEQMKAPRRRAPSPMRSPNGASGFQPNAIETMSDEQFDRMERNISEKGMRYSLK